LAQAIWLKLFRSSLPATILLAFLRQPAPMGCHSGKVSGSIDIGKPEKPASPNGTLLAAQVSQEKEPSTAEKETSTAGRNCEVAPAGVTMIVTDSGKLYSTYEGIARALDVYYTGWVAAFTDVKNGDTGTLLSETSTPHDAVALRIHRNGAIICMARKGVELAGFNGVWGSGQQYSGKFARQISGDKLVWSDGKVSPIQIDEATGVLSLTFDGGDYTAEHYEDDKIHWCDGDVWSRHQGPVPKDDVPVWQAILAGNFPEDPMPISPAAATESRLSTVDEATEESAGAAISPNPIQVGPSLEDPKSLQVLGTSEVESAPLSPEKPLFALAAAQNGHVDGGSEKKVRRERTMCCC